MAVKLVDFFVRKEGTSHEEFVDYWLNEHVELVAALPNLLKYETGVPTDLHGYETMLPKGPGQTEYDGLFELYFEDVDAMFEAFDSEAGQRVQEDVEEFLDASAGQTFVMDSDGVGPDGTTLDVEETESGSDETTLDADNSDA